MVKFFKLPQANIKYLRGIMYKIKLAIIRTNIASHDSHGVVNRNVLFFKKSK